MTILIDDVRYILTKSEQFTVCYEYRKDNRTFVVGPAELAKAYREGRLSGGDELYKRLVMRGY